VRDADRADRSVERVRLDDGLLAYELTQHERYRSFEDTYTGRDVAPALETVCEEFRPDVVHVQHLEGLGTKWLAGRTVSQARLFMTVHDHALTCANGGQRFHPELGACPLLDARRCADCTAHMNRVGLAMRRWSRAARARRRGGKASGADAGSATGWIGRGRALAGSLDHGGERRVQERWRTMRALADIVDTILVPSHSLRADLIAFGIPEPRVRYLRHGIELDRFTRRPAPKVGRRFGYLGSIVPHKGVALLVEAFRSLPRDAELLVAGSTQSDSAYVARLRKEGLPPNVRFLGEIEPTAIPELLAGLDCLVVPSIWEENAPLVVLEAFAAGVPVIGSRLGGLPELLADGGGTTFAPGSVDALRDAILEAYEDESALARWHASLPVVRDIDDYGAELARIYEGDA
jgi:glycosyltransferase involved in cell wall biosynthesis